MISITLNESKIEEGIQILTVFYREKPIVEKDVPLDLKYHVFPRTDGWDDLLKQA